MASSLYDWDAIELDYRAGVLPLHEISARHGPSASSIKSKAKRYGWKRKTKLDPGTVHGVAVRKQTGAKHPADSVHTEISVTEDATMAAVAVLQAHRSDLGKLRMVANKYAGHIDTVLDKITRAMDSDDPEERAQLVRDAALLMGPRESPADMLNKLSTVMLRLVGLERQAYGLDVLLDPSAPSNGMAEGSAMQRISQMDPMERERRIKYLQEILLSADNKAA